MVQTLLLFFLLFVTSLFGERGIVIAVCDRYVEDLLPSLHFLRHHLHCTLPIEVWHAGDELSLPNQMRLSAFTPLTIHDMTEKFDHPATHFRGFQIKGYLGLATRFDEFIIMDADLLFYQNPESLFDHPGYQKTGAFFFCDQESYRFYGYLRIPGRLYHGGLLSSYNNRRDFLTTLIDKPSNYLPSRWHHYWQDEHPTPLDPLPSEHQESGCVVIDKKRHLQGLEEVRKLNENYHNTYRYVWGDKETFWIGFEMATEPYYMNPTVPAKIVDQWTRFFPLKIAKIRLVQLIDGQMIYQQKRPRSISEKAVLIQRDKQRSQRQVTSEEVQLLNIAAEIQKPDL